MMDVTASRRSIITTRWLLVMAVAISLSCGDSAVVRNGAGENANNGSQQEETRTDFQAWFDSQHTVVAPWAYEIDAEVVENAIIEEERVIFDRDGNEELAELEVNEIIYANSLDVPDANISRKVKRVEEDGDQIIIHTEVAKLNEVYLKLSAGGQQSQQLNDSDSVMTREQPLKASWGDEADEDPIHIEMKRTVDAQVCMADGGRVRLCQVEEAGETGHGESEVSLFVEPTVDATLNSLDLEVNIEPPDEDTCTCVAYYYHIDEHGNSHASIDERYATIERQCSDYGMALENNFFETWHNFVNDIQAVRDQCEGDPSNFDFGIDADLQLSLPAAMGFKQTFELEEMELAEWELPTKIVIPLSFVSLVIQPTISLTAKLISEGEVGLSVKDDPPTASFPINFGLRWNEGEGASSYEQNPNRSEVESFSMGQAQFSGSVKLETKVAGEGNIESKFWDAAGPVFTISPYLTGGLEAGVEGGGDSVNGTCRISTQAGVSVQVGGEAGVPFTSIEETVKFDVFNTCDSQWDDSWVGQLLCPGASSEDPCSADTEWVRVEVHSNTDGVEDPVGLDLDSLMLKDGDGRNFEVQELMVVQGNGAELPYEPEIVTEARFEEDKCVDENASVDYWTERVVSIPNGAALFARFDRSITDGDVLVFERVDDGFCSSSGVPAISIGDKPYNVWAIEDHVPRIWNTEKVYVHMVKDQAGIMAAHARSGN